MLKKSDPDIIQSYFEDHSGLLGGHADRVVIPSDEKEIAEYLRAASAERRMVTVAGAGTGVTGGRVPFGGEVLSMEALNRFIDIRTGADGEKTAVVQPAVTVQELKKAVEKEGLMYPPDPTEQSSFIGGNIATNASGSRGLRYGSTRKYVRRLNVVMANGERLQLRRGEIFADEAGYITVPLSGGPFRLKLPDYLVPRIKNAAGYYNVPGMDIIDLFIGQEGTLGVVTEIEVALCRLIERTISGIAFFPKKEFAWDFVDEVRRMSGDKDSDIEALSLEYFDKNALELLRGDYPIIPLFADAAILFEQDISQRDEDSVVNAWSTVLEKHGAPLDKVWFGANRREQESFRDFRHRLPEKVNEIVKHNRLPKVGTDIAVPDRYFRAMMQYYYERFNASGIDYLVFGHIGENHLHANILPGTEKDYLRSRDLYTEIAEKAIGFKGTVSAEHGIGKLKHRFLEKMVGESGLREMARLKKTLDPASILSPGNIFPKELLER
jgi:D-lactate dehydrogenase (cytochrome)